MKQSAIAKAAVLEQTRLAIHRFFGREMDAFFSMLDEKCVWIGSYEFQYVKSREEFRNAVKEESKEAPVTITDEEYTVLNHDRYLFAVYGRFTITTQDADGALLLVKQRLTFIWRYIKNELKAIHIHCSDAKDVPLQYEIGRWEDNTNQLRWFDYIRRIDSANKNRIQIKDIDGIIHCLLPEEIFYIKAIDKICAVYTGTKTFRVRKTLSQMLEEIPGIIQIHRNCLVNIIYLETIRRYTATLTDGTELPIGKERYSKVKESLNK